MNESSHECPIFHNLLRKFGAITKIVTFPSCDRPEATFSKTYLLVSYLLANAHLFILRRWILIRSSCLRQVMFILPKRGVCTGIWCNYGQWSLLEKVFHHLKKKLAWKNSSLGTMKSDIVKTLTMVEKKYGKYLVGPW